MDLGPQGYAVVKVNKVMPRANVDPEQARQEAAQYGRWWTSAEAMAYYNLLKERYKVQILVPKPSAEGGPEGAAR